MSDKDSERRKYSRFDTKSEVFFKVVYDFRTRIEFKVVDDESNDKTYTGLSQNVSVEGLCFSSPKVLEKGQMLQMSVQISGRKEPVELEGEVRWAKESIEESQKGIFDVGVQLRVINGQSVDTSIFFDDVNKTYWSSVLEIFFLGGVPPQKNDEE